MSEEIKLLSNQVKGIYFSYINGEYGVFLPNKDKPAIYRNMSNPTELYDNYITSNNYDDYFNDSKLLIGKIQSSGIDNAESIFKDLIYDLHSLYSNPNINEDIISERILNIDNPAIKTNFEKQIKEYEDNKYSDLRKRIRDNLTARKHGELEIGRRLLSEYLTKRYGAILRKDIGDIYVLDGNGYIPISHDDLIISLKEDFGDNFIHDNDLKSAIGYISDRREPVPNIIKFNNTLYDMSKLKEVESDKPIFTLLQIDYDLNPNAKSILFKQFLETTFKRTTSEKTSQAVKGVFQISGYFFTSGNIYQILPIFTGLAGAGKSTFFNIITAIFGNKKISGVSLQNLEKDTHSSSQFLESHLNIIRDSDDSMITNNSLIKNLTGNESFPINPKYKPSIDLPAEQVPKPILVCNRPPAFKVYDDGIIRRFLVVEFEVSFKDDDDKIIDLDKKIISDKSEIEWFIYNSIKEYKQMVDNGEDFIFKISEDETMEIIHKHTHPLNYLINDLILKHDPEAYKWEKENNKSEFRPVFTNELVDILLEYANESHIDIPTDRHNRINKKYLLNIIKEEFDLFDGELIYNRQTDKFDIHRDYKARAERWTSPNGEPKREKVYPNLIPTETYRRIIKKLKNNPKVK